MYILPYGLYSSLVASLLALQYGGTRYWSKLTHSPSVYKWCLRFRKVMIIMITFILTRNFLSPLFECFSLRLTLTFFENEVGYFRNSSYWGSVHTKTCIFEYLRTTGMLLCRRTISNAMWEILPITIRNPIVCVAVSDIYDVLKTFDEGIFVKGLVYSFFAWIPPPIK